MLFSPQMTPAQKHANAKASSAAANKISASPIISPRFPLAVQFEHGGSLLELFERGGVLGHDPDQVVLFKFH